MTDTLNVLVDEACKPLEGLQTILLEEKPNDLWEDTDWDYQRTKRLEELVVAKATTALIVEDLGWIEHTGDWDWWARFTFADGSEWVFECGTYVIGFKTTDGEYRSSKDLREAYRFDRDFHITHLIVDAQWYPNPEDLDVSREEIVYVPVGTLNSIHLGYDT